MFEIKPAVPADAKTLADLGIKTFRETFASENSQENLDRHLRDCFDEEIQLSEILDPNRRIKLAWDGPAAVGFSHLRTGPVDPSVIGVRPIELLRLYVEAGSIGKGVGAALIQDCIQTSRDEGYEALWLGVWERNVRAQAFYRRWDFVERGSHTFHLGADAQRDIIMERIL